MNQATKVIAISRGENFSNPFVNDVLRRDTHMALKAWYENFQYEEKRINCYDNKEVVIIPISKILLIEAASNYSIIHLEDRKITTSKTLKYWQEKIDHTSFVRSHQSYLINTKFVNGIDLSNNLVKLRNHRIPISRNQRTQLIDKLQVC